MTYPLTTLKTKKKSSDLDWPIAMSIVSVLGLFAILTFAFRAVTMQSKYAMVPAEIPLVPASVDDPSFHNFEESTYDSLKEHTTAVVMTLKSFYFGDLESFSKDIEKTSNKFAVPHVDNIPRTGDLIKDMKEWQKNRNKKQNIPIDGILVLIPSGDIPMPIVIQVLNQLRTYGEFKRVILGGGFAL